MIFSKSFKVFFALFLFFLKNNYAQQDKRLEYLFSQEKNKYVEKIYAHTDKSQYFAGELMWFKIYNLNSFNNSLSSLSKVGYIELLYKNKEVVYQSKILLDKGIGAGSFSLGKELKGGVYILKAYTNLMKNAGPNVFFEKEISIVNTFNLNLAAPKADSTDVDIQFFPEGGDLVENIQSNVAFKITDNKVKGIDIGGWIIDDKNDTIAKIKTFKFGIGRFILSPQTGRAYKAIFIDSKGKRIVKELPKYKSKGYTIALKDNGAFWNASIFSNTGETGIYVLVHNGKKISYAKAEPLQGGLTNLNIRKSDLDEGLHHLTVFDSYGRPVAERIFYKPITKRLNFKMEFPSNSYSFRKKVDLSLSAKVSNDILKEGYASLSVYKINTLPIENEVDIISYIHLSSELKGYIENPSYYFSNNDEESQLAFDNLLLTQGWRRFNWNKNIENNNSTLQYLPEYNGILISGKLAKNNSKPSSGIDLYLSSPKQKGLFYHTITDSLGNFIFNTKDIYGKNEIIIQANPIQDTTSSITINNPFYNNQENNSLIKQKQPFLNLISNKKDLEESHFALQVQEIYQEGLYKGIIPSIAEKYNFYGQPYKSYLLADYTKFNTLEEVLREYVSEVFVYKRQREFDLRLVSANGPLEENPLILVDGVPYFDINEAMKISPENIEKLEVIRDKYYYGGKTYYGILHFYSKGLGLADYKINPNALIIDYEGLELQREFYSPKYDNDASINNSIPDYRNVIYWQPYIVLKGNEEKKLSFYTSDLEGKYRAVIQGISENGIPGYTSFEFEVKK